MIEVEIIDVDGTSVKKTVPANKNIVQFANDEIGWVEAVGLERGRIMLVDEEGLLKGLPFNKKASELAVRTIVGKVIVCDRKAFL